MQVSCGKCKTKFEGHPDLVLKQSPGFCYFKCPNCNKIVTVKKTQPVSEKAGQINLSQPGSTAMATPGWLIVHDETVKPQSFDLKPGKNSVGRSSSMEVDIAIETDDVTMSRQHCIIDVSLHERSGEYSFCINDFKSTNGTILNGAIERKLHEQDLIYLNDGDTFQLGLTKVVFKKNSDVKHKAAVVKEVLGQPYMPTVVITKERLKHIYKM